MKMPTSLLAGTSRALPWKPGHSLSVPYGEGTFPSPSSSSSSPHHDSRLPLVSRSLESTVSPFLPRPPHSGRDRRTTEESGDPSSALPPAPATCAGRGGEERRKRFPILGPTRQDTEMYFRNRRSGRRSAKDRLKGEARPLMTRSADRVVLPESTPTPRLKAAQFAKTPTGAVSKALPTTTTAASSLPTKALSTGGGRSQGRCRDSGEAENVVHAFHTSLPSCDPGPACTAPPHCPSRSEPAGGSQSMATSSPAQERLENSPEHWSAALPLPVFQHLHGPSLAVHSGGRRRSELPLCFDSVQQCQRMPRVPRDQAHKTLQPSKHGFHLRSKSPTFKRLVDAVEKLQDVVEDCDLHGQRVDRTGLCRHAGRSSPAGLALPAVAGVWDGEAEGDGEGEGESDEEVSYLHPHPFLSSLPHSTYRSKHISTAVYDSHRQNRSISTTMSTNPKHPAIRYHTGPDAELINGWGAWEVDSLSVESAMEPAALSVPVGMTSSEAHTQLHLFLPRLADTLREDGSTKASTDRPYPSRPADTHTLSLSAPRSKDVPQILPPQRASQRPHPQQTSWASGEGRSGRPQDRRFTSPVRVVKRDRTPSNRRRVMAASTVEIYETYEPYLKGEHLKEKLEDFPTLISLEQD